MKRLIFFLLLALFAFSSSAYEVIPICAKAQRRDGSWSTNYAIKSAKVYKGSELNQATRTYNYNAYDTYVLIWWDEGEVSIIHLDFSIVSLYNNEGKDQLGRKWSIDKRQSPDSYCF